MDIDMPDIQDCQQDKAPPADGDLPDAEHHHMEPDEFIAPPAPLTPPPAPYEASDDQGPPPPADAAEQADAQGAKSPDTPEGQEPQPPAQVCAPAGKSFGSRSWSYLC